MKQYAISIYLDTRRILKSGKYPVKLRVFTNNPRKQKLFPTIFELTEIEYQSAWETVKPRGEFKDLRNKLMALEQHANLVAEGLEYFSFEIFEKKLLRKSTAGQNVEYHFEQIINKLRSSDQIRTAESNESAVKSLSEFSEKALKRKFDSLYFQDITADILQKYERYMTETKGRSITTVGMYLRAVRAVFNKAIEEKEISIELYPFGKRKYQIPSAKKVKKAFAKDQLKHLFEAIPKTHEQEKAKDFFFFSYACSGMNTKDICLLRPSDLKGDRIEFVRAKTKLTSKSNQKTIVVYLNDFSRSVINKYGSKTGDYLFPVFNNKMSAEEQLRVLRNFIRFINQHLKKICEDNNLPVASTYWARHSFATNAIRSGASLEFIQESLGHNNITTTQNYFAGFDNESRKEFAKNIMDFD